MNRSPWRLEEVDGGDEQYPVESRFAVRHTPPDEQDPRFDRRRSISSVLRYVTPLPINRTPVSTVGGSFRPFCGTPHPPDEHDPRFDRRRSVSSVLRYTTPLPINRTPVSTIGGPFTPFRGMPGLFSIACTVQALLMNTTTHSVPTQPVGSHAFRCLPMNTTHSIASP